MCVITTYGAQCLVAGCRGSGAVQQAMRPGRGMLHDKSCNQAPHTIGGNNTHIVSNS